jgi:hypothetical protein
MVRLSPMPVTWRHPGAPGRIVVPWLKRLEKVLVSWEETPYVPGQQCKGAGVDCIRFGCAVLDELYRRPLTDLPIRAADASMHDREGSFSVMRQIIRRYPDHITVEDGSVEPGDILVVGPRAGGPGHMMIVGHQRNTVWQASADRVHFTGLYLPDSATLFRTFRMVDRENWA